MRVFNTTGPCDPARHYTLPPLERAPTAMTLVRQQNYVAVSGPRQSGKTSLLKAIVDGINAEGWARSVILSCEGADQRYAVTDVDEAECRLVERWAGALQAQALDVAWPAVAGVLSLTAGTRISGALMRYAQAAPLPLIVILDEVDCLARNPFGSLLRQVRDGFQYRPTGFPHSVVLAGMRSLRDHDIALGGDGSGSPFNVVEFLTVGNFTREELARLYAQHTAETGQSFTEDALALAWDQTRGQPWLVNAIARTCVTELVTDAAQSIDALHVEEAVRRVEAARPTHLASLGRRLSEERVLNVVAPAIIGSTLQGVPSDDILYVCELGILAERGDGVLGAANPIYARSLMKALAEPIRANVAAIHPTWRKSDGSIDLERLRLAFLDFWSVHGRALDPLVARREVVPHVVMTAFLDRVVNGGGRVDREFDVGRGKLDVLVRHRELKLPIEIKVRTGKSGDPVPKGLQQLDRYCEALRVEYAWLVVFDQRPSARKGRLQEQEVVTPGGRRVLVVRA
jgi:hypothetical protein